MRKSVRTRPCLYWCELVRILGKVIIILAATDHRTQTGWLFGQIECIPLPFVPITTLPQLFPLITIRLGLTFNAQADFMIDFRESLFFDDFAPLSFRQVTMVCLRVSMPPTVSYLITVDFITTEVMTFKSNKKPRNNSVGVQAGWLKRSSCSSTRHFIRTCLYALWAFAI